MRKLAAVLLLLGLTAPASAEVDSTLMDLSLGLWMLSAGDGAFCPLTLGDEPVQDGRALEGGGDCRDLDPVMAQATAWRIDVPGELVFLNDKGKVLVKMSFDEPNGTFRTAPDRAPQLALEPSE